jgi:hypothetical protein
MWWWVLAGCGELTRPEIEDLVDDDTRILADVEARLDGIETLVQPTLRHGQGDGDYVYQGVLEAESGWDAGTVTVDGSGSSREQNAIQFSALDLTFDGVVLHDTTYDGTTHATIGVTVIGGRVSVSYKVTGTLSADGAVTGTAEMDWSMDAASDENDGQPTYDGTVNGRDLSRIMP